MNLRSLSVNCQPDCLGRGLEGLHWEVEAQLEADLDMQEGLCPASLCPASLWESPHVCCQELEHLSESTLGNDWLWGLIKKRSPLSGLQSSSGTQHIKGTAFLSHVVHHLGQDNAEWGPKRSSDKDRVL